MNEHQQGASKRENEMDVSTNEARRSDLLPFLLNTGPIRFLDLGIRYHDRLAACLHEMKVLESQGDIEVNGDKKAFQEIVTRISPLPDNGTDPPQKFYQLVKEMPDADKITISLTRKGFRTANS